jgi:hypothetical protein
MEVAVKADGTLVKKEAVKEKGKIKTKQFLPLSSKTFMVPYNHERCYYSTNSTFSSLNYL